MFKVLAPGMLLIFLCCPALAQEKLPPVCPTISVTGPAGVPSLGEPVSFEASVSGNIPKGVTYLWGVSSGTIIGGQGTTAIRVGNWTAENLTATLQIKGLPENCPNFASESLPVCSCLEAILIDQFSAPLSRIEKGRFKNAVTEIKNNPNNHLHIIEYFPKSTSSLTIRNKVRRLSEVLTREMKLDKSYFTIVTAKADELSTKIYRIPPGAANPVP